MSAAQLEALSSYTACDIADALLKLEVPGAGFLADIAPTPNPTSSGPLPTLQKIIAPASTVLFVSRSTPSFPTSAGSGPLNILNRSLAQPLPNIPAGESYSDLTKPGTIVLISQPPGQKCAVVGGIMAARIRKLGAKGVLVDGRVRDLDAVGAQGIPFWSRGTSIVGSGGEAQAWATEIPISVDNTQVSPGDIVMMDPGSNAAVCIPAQLMGQVLELLPKLVSADEKVIQDVEDGVSVTEAFKRHRGK